MAEKISAKVVTDTLRNAWVETIKCLLETENCEVLQTASGTLYVPCLDQLGDERWVKLSIIIPKASEEDGTDGYSLAKDYEMTCAEKAEKQAAKDAEKAKKIAKDAEKRKKKAEKDE